MAVEITQQTSTYVINRILSDNYTLFFMFLFLASVFIFLIIYFSKQLIETIKTYYKYLGKENTVNVEDDVLEDEEIDPYALKIHQDNVTGDFYNKLDEKYKKYNQEKALYLQQEYKMDDSDDKINREILHKKNDDYEYKKE